MRALTCRVHFHLGSLGGTAGRACPRLTFKLSLPSSSTLVLATPAPLIGFRWCFSPNRPALGKGFNAWESSDQRPTYPVCLGKGKEPGSHISVPAHRGLSTQGSDRPRLCSGRSSLSTNKASPTPVIPSWKFRRPKPPGTSSTRFHPREFHTSQGPDLGAEGRREPPYW